MKFEICGLGWKVETLSEAGGGIILVACGIIYVCTTACFIDFEFLKNQNRIKGGKLTKRKKVNET